MQLRTLAPLRPRLSRRDERLQFLQNYRESLARQIVEIDAILADASFPRCEPRCPSAPSKAGCPGERVPSIVLPAQIRRPSLGTAESTRLEVGPS